MKKKWKNYVEWVPNTSQGERKNTDKCVDRIIHIVIDGVPADFLYHNNLKNLSVMQNEGCVFTNCLSIWPTLTGPAHTSMNSGALPLRTGINLNQYYDFTSRKLESINPLAISRAESIAEALFKKGLTSAGICGHMHRSLQYFVSEALIGHDAKLVTDYAINALNNFSPDYLQIVYFTVDTVQHHYGAKSKEALEALHWVDEEFGRLLKRIEQDQKETVFVVTADHGQDLIEENIMEELSAITLKSGFETYGYGRFAVLKENKYKSSRDLLEESLLSRQFTQRVFWEEDLYKLGVNPEKVGTGVVLLNSGYTTGGDYKGNHGSYTANEAKVPLIFYGTNIKQGERNNPCEIIDIAPTICHLLGVDNLANSEGRVLTELYGQQPDNYQTKRQKTLLNLL